MPKRTFNKKCKYKYDEFRPGIQNASKKNSSPHTLTGRCILIKHDNRKCLFEGKTHLNCDLSPLKRKKKKKKRSGELK